MQIACRFYSRSESMDARSRSQSERRSARFTTVKKKCFHSNPNAVPAITATQRTVEEWTVNHAQENREFHSHQPRFLACLRRQRTAHLRIGKATGWMLMTSPGRRENVAFGGRRALILVDGVTKTAAPRFALRKGGYGNCRSDPPSPHLGPRAACPPFRRWSLPEMPSRH